ncbi:hypothetical protein KFU94_38200 [Chloroflexi bacterium TSY]|nr:hypothetical protein [Chloroflexi bacterium TSY]
MGRQYVRRDGVRHACCVVPVDEPIGSQDFIRANQSRVQQHPPCIR